MVLKRPVNKNGFCAFVLPRSLSNTRSMLAFCLSGCRSHKLLTPSLVCLSEAMERVELASLTAPHSSCFRLIQVGEGFSFTLRENRRGIREEVATPIHPPVRSLALCSNGYGSKLNHQELDRRLNRPCCHSPGFHWYRFLTSQMRRVQPPSHVRVLRTGSIPGLRAAGASSISLGSRAQRPGALARRSAVSL